MTMSRLNKNNQHSATSPTSLTLSKTQQVIIENNDTIRLQKKTFITENDSLLLKLKML